MIKLAGNWLQADVLYLLLQKTGLAASWFSKIAPTVSAEKQKLCEEELWALRTNQTALAALYGLRRVLRKVGRKKGVWLLQVCPS